jgi:transcriptional regulator with XRE-family HTH domain
VADRKRIFRGDRLKLIRENRGLTQDDLNTRLGFGPTQIYRYETGKADPSPDVLVRIAVELEVTTDWLLGLVNEPTERLQENELSNAERKLLSAFRRGDLRDLMRIAAEDSNPNIEISGTAPKPVTNG